MDVAAEPTARKIEIHRAQAGRELTDAMSLGPMDATQVAGIARLSEADYQEGFVVKVLFSNEALGMSLTYSWFKAGFPLPRHSHSADCLYYVISGEMHFGEEILAAGDTVFVPAGSLYTFETGAEGIEFIEFRKAATYDIRFKAPAKAWERQLAQTRMHAPAWRDAAPPLAVRRMMGEA